MGCSLCLPELFIYLHVCLQHICRCHPVAFWDCILPAIWITVISLHPKLALQSCSLSQLDELDLHLHELPNCK